MLSGRRKRSTKRGKLVLMQALEQRTLFSADLQAFPTFVLSANPASVTPPFTPAQIRQAYGLDSVTEDGAGQTIAIVDAYNDPDIVSDVNTFIGDYSLQQFNVAGGPTFTVENQTGSTSNLPANAVPGEWDVEESLDVEWAHTIAPRANIILFEANSNNNDDLYATVNTARNTSGVSVVSMSWGGPEDPSELSEDSVFTTPAGHQGVTFIASTGDRGEPGGYPAYSPNILAVGGTSLTINDDGSYGGETGWSDSGGGISQYEAQPDFQSALAGAFSATQRTIPDVSWLADPNTGVDVVDSFYAGSTTAFGVGGTSLATPMWGGLISMVNQELENLGKSSLDGPSQTLPMLYNLPSGDFNDITSGNNGFAAGPGYDLVTGRGTPNVSSLILGMVGGSRLYVDSSAPGPTHDGSSWDDAYLTLTDALPNATAGDEILISQGTYYPGSSADPGATFQLADNVAIYGGFAGYGASDPNAENVVDYPTFLSGDIGATASYHVVTASGTDSTAILDGVTITDGDATDNGGGLYNIGGSPTITNCVFTGNNAANAGGAIYNSAASPIFVNCTFTGNSATGGGAVENDNSSSASFVGCTFTDNTAVDGGAIEDDSSASALRGCTFSSNTASGVGGAMEIDDSSASVVIACVFTDNSAGEGGGVDSDQSSTPELVNCLFVGNSGGAVEDNNFSTPTLINCTLAGNTGAAVEIDNDGQATLVNCILWDNASGVLETSGGATDITYSDIQGGFTGAGNIDADPQFIRDPSGSDNGDQHLSLTSPAVDAGDNAAVPADVTTDLDGRSRFVDIPGIGESGAIVDMGAYETWQSVVYVDSRATGRGTGLSWDDAQTSLTAALSSAIAGQTIEVAQGVYKPTDTTFRAATFQLVDGVTLEGGFAGVGADDPDARDFVATPTILSGDIGVTGDSSDNSYHVVNASYTYITTVFDGFTITGGNADADPNTDIDDALGGGMLNNGGDLTVSNCTFIDNSAIFYGGAILNQADASPTLIDCTFTDNVAGNSSSYNAFGGAIGNYYGDPALIDCTFTGNSADSPDGQAGGGAIENEYSTPSLTGCTFTDNSATGAQGGYGGAIDNEDSSSPALADCAFDDNQTNLLGGAMFNDGSSPALDNCTFTDNRTVNFGGAMANFDDADPTLTDCTFSGNMAVGNATYDALGGAIGNYSSDPTLIDCTLTGNSAVASDLIAAGGGIENQYSAPTLIGCTFTRNYAYAPDQSGQGGAIDNEESAATLTNCAFDGNWTNSVAGAVLDIDCSPTLSNCAFVGNSATDYGGAMFNYDSASPNLINCTFNANIADYGGAIVDNGAVGSPSKPVITNSILWGDQATDSGNEIYKITSTSSATVNHSDIQGGYSGTGNINSDPQFLRAVDFGVDGTPGTADDYYGNLALGSTSPAIDDGANAAVRSGITTDLAGDPRIVNIPGIHDPGAVVDLGAYERQLLNALSFNFNSSQQVVVQFSEDVSASLTASDLQVVQALGGSAITASSFSYNSGTNTATFSFASLPAGVYQAVLNNGAITDASTNALAATYSFSFLYVPTSQSLSLSGDSQVYTIQQLSVSTGARLDIGNNELIVQYNAGDSPASSIQSLIASGQNDGNWNGAGIVSADAAGSISTSVGYFDDGSEVTIAHTWKGDANLDGVVNADDLSLVMAGLANNQTSWQYGNFNYDSQINADDWMALSIGIAVSNGQRITPSFAAASPSASSAAAIQAGAPASAANVGNILHSSDSSNESVLGKMPTDVLHI